MPQSIAQLWSGILDGNPRSWEEMVRRFNPLVVAAARAHGLAAVDLEDCAQQTWLALYTGRAHINDPLAIPTWLVTVAKRKAQRLQIRQKAGTTAEQEFNPEANSVSPEDLYVKALEAARLHIALELLDSRCARLLKRLFLASEEYTYQEIAEELRIAPNSLGPIRSRCLARLRKILSELDHG